MKAHELPPVATGPAHGFRYDVAYEVPAASQLEAIANATEGLRSALTVRGVRSCVEVRVRWWRVVLSVWEAA